jgi:hypothetical protein
VLRKFSSGVGKNSIRCWGNLYQVLGKILSGVEKNSIKCWEKFYQVLGKLPSKEKKLFLSGRKMKADE